MDSLPTTHHPAERDSDEEIRRQHERLMSIPVLRELLDALQCWVLVLLNECRQIVCVNRAALDCAHKSQVSGCGTSDFATVCGGTTQVASAHQGQTGSRECRIQEADPGKALDLKVWTIPLVSQGERYAILAAIDISHEKRRRELERIFFHDALGMLGTVRGLAELLPKADPRDMAGYCGDIVLSVDQLVEEIAAQRHLSDAENGELAVNFENCPLRPLLESLAAAYRAHEAAAGKTIVVDPDTVQDVVVTDRTMLRRVLGNMIKNALEAEAPGSGIVIGGGLEGDGRFALWVRNPTVMPREVRLQVFQRSFSTKHPSRGLGTYSMRLLTERYLGGAVSYTSAEGSGTEFRVRLPSVLRPGFGERSREGQGPSGSRFVP